jgi:hypothetical protein
MQVDGVPGIGQDVGGEVRARAYLASPDLAVTNTTWTRDAAMSERAFTRLSGRRLA